MRLTPGEYRWVLLPSADSQAAEGSVVVGRLWLWSASTADRSPATGERAAPALGRVVVYTGATNAPLGRAGIRFDTTQPRLFPPAASRDPVYPGLVVVRPSAAGAGLSLWIGTENLRAAHRDRILDGPGAVFRIEAGDGRGGFLGHWGPAGRGGSEGQYCAQYVGSAPRR